MINVQSRYSSAKNRIPIRDYRDAMTGIYSTSVSSATLDEAPQAYKPMDEIIQNIEPTCEIIDRITPVYNFKAS